MSKALFIFIVPTLGGLFFIGVLALVVNFFASMLGRTPYQKSVTRITKERDEAQRENAIRSDISEKEKVAYEVRIDQEFARSLDAVERLTSVANQTARWAFAASGTAGLILLAMHYFDVLKWMLASASFLTTAAFAAETPKPELTGLLPYVAAGVIALMAVSFLIALGTLMILKDTKENQARIKAADNLVKTFGGFFTGLATTLLR
ncbi:hypothetical protein [Bradyrhizobium valentinum]|uniref:Uncharacterized protein n=1 Tax=Bradyrhizobium valentinum TaxID=1518501 RepID=A0A0R3LJG1_9BRAD|nr:hypothetical protein [Bradyrhizobium valentinum]KRR00252.1 hypothetical protein CQ10_22740 [Bradyrhizobium valentinum]KRR05491.1 hypothetical protein CP49_03125 [Bradyrhizobium valentinum]